MDIQTILRKADGWGYKAAEEADPQLIGVEGSPDPFPVCGFAWVTVKGERGKRLAALKEYGFQKRVGAPGVSLWVSEFGQSYARKRAYAAAFAAVLREHGFDASYGARLD